MKITLLASFLVMAAYFLLLYAGVGLIFGAFFARYLVILYVMEAYDILFFDWVLLCHSNFFPHFYPEVKGIAARSCSGTTKKRILRTFCSTSPSPLPSHGCVRFSEAHSA